MDVIKMYNAANKLRRLISVFNIDYMEQREEKDTNLLVQYLQQIYKIGMLEPKYWNNTEVDLQIIQEQISEVEDAIAAEDFVFIFDKVNYELWKIVRSILETLFERDAETLSNFFWEENRKALERRFPIVLKQLEAMPENSQHIYVRSYGIRGKVVYRKNGSVEMDVYSAYDLSRSKEIVERHLRRYRKICVWGCNGGAELNDILLAAGVCEDLDFEVYVTDLDEFKQVLLNTHRKGVLLSPKINWKFIIDEEDFIKDFDLQSKAVSYIYVCWSRTGLTVLKQFICNNLLNSNIGEHNEKYVN